MFNMCVASGVKTASRYFETYQYEFLTIYSSHCVLLMSHKNAIFFAYFYIAVLETDCYKNKLTVIRIKIKSSSIKLERWKSIINNLSSKYLNGRKMSILLRLFNKE